MYATTHQKGRTLKQWGRAGLKEQLNDLPFYLQQLRTT